MPAFQFPDPAVEQTVVNTLTGSTYQWKADPGKWVITAKLREVSDIIWEGDNPPDPVGDYKLWYSTDTLELYFYYCDANNVCAWVPTSAPITMLEDLDAGLAEVKADVVAINQATITNENRIETFVAFSETEPPAYPDAITPVVDEQGDPLLDENGQQVVTYTPDPANHKFWLKTDTNQLHILRLQDADLRTYAYELVSAGSEIWFGNDPPTEESFDLWFDTTRLELLIKYEDQWWPVSLPASQLEDLRAVLERELGEVIKEVTRVELEAGKAVVDLSNSIDLEKVLTNGAVADQGIVLRSPGALESDADAIVLAPTISRILLAAEKKENFLPTIQLVEGGGGNAAERRTAEIELDDGRLDINMTEQLDEVHFRFRDEEELILRHRSNPAGPSQLFGKLKVDPGTQGNEAVTYGQLSILEEEIEQLAGSQERGVWNYTSNAELQPGEYTIVKEFLEPEKQKERLDEQLTQCLIDANSDPLAASECQRVWSDAIDKIDGNLEVITDQWEEAEYYKIHKTDSKNIEHKLLAENLVVDIFNIEDDGFMAGNCTNAINVDQSNKTQKELTVEVTQFRGSAHGPAGIKILNLEGSESLGNYVRKSGDEMTGDLTINGGQLKVKGAATNTDTLLHIHASEADVENARILKVQNTEKDDVFTVRNDGSISAKSLWTPTNARHLTPKGWVAEQIQLLRDELSKGSDNRPATYAWKFNVNDGSETPDIHVCNYDEPDVRNRGVFRLSYTPEIGGIIDGVSSGEKLIYKASSTNLGVYATVWYYSDGVGKWKWKGSGPVQEIILKPNHLRVKYADHDCTNNGSLSNSFPYYLTISGFF